MISLFMRKSILIAAYPFLMASILIASDPIRVVSFSTVTTEIAREVGGDRVQVAGLVKPGVDPHGFEPKPDDLKQVGQAQLILASGKHLENYTGKLKESADAKAEFVGVGDAFPSLKLKDGEKVIEDPHWWHRVANVKKAAKVICDALIKISPADREAFTKNAGDYIAKLDALEKWAKSKIAELPRDRRKLVTSHDAFQYFARDFGFTVYPVEGVSAGDETSSKKVADLVRTIKAQHVKAVFFESIENPKVLTEITGETGAKIGGELYADGLGGGDAATYDGMFRHNVTTIVEALK